MAKIIPAENRFKKEEKKEPEIRYHIKFPENAGLSTVIKFLNLLNLYVTVTDKLTQEYKDFIQQHPECCVRVEETVEERLVDDVTIN